MSLSLKLKKLFYSQTDFLSQLDDLRFDHHSAASDDVDCVVDAILAKVRKYGDAAILEYTRTFDQRDLQSMSELHVSSERLEQALTSISAEQKQALLVAKQRIEKYHSYQKMDSWFFKDDLGHVLGQKVSPLERVGIYVPGGKASYPSSVLMNAIPAKVAGVKEIIMVVPAPKGELNELVLAAAAIVGVDRVFTIGGAQAVAALAYGTETIPRVDKIVGPGNAYVASAKKQVFGKVGIDMLAGPSEILIYCDGKTPPDWIAMDMFSQAEHDEQAQAILVSQDENFLSLVETSIRRLLSGMDRANIIEKSLNDRAAFIHVENDMQALDVINRIAPEHLELSLESEHAEMLVESITNAGAVFIGRASAETFGDYCAGSNHVLPTSGSARFSSPLSVYDFIKRTSLISLHANGLDTLVKTTVTLAQAEGLQAHALSAEYRAKEMKNG